MSAVVNDTSVKIIPDPYNVDRITSEDAVQFKPKNCYFMSFKLVDEPIPGSEENSNLNLAPPSGDELDALVEHFPAPPEWADE
mgnify:CR=1 FL=1